MLARKRTPGPPWLPIPPFADRATVLVGDFGIGQTIDCVAALVLVDRRFAVVSTSPWTLDGRFGNMVARNAVAVPNDAEWWALGCTVTQGAVDRDPWDIVRVRWGLRL